MVEDTSKDSKRPRIAVEAKEDVAAAHRLREAYDAPSQSKFRVAAVLRFVRADGTSGTIEAVNAEPHDANIRGAICAERAAMCVFQRDEAAKGSRVVRVVCVTDRKNCIYPGPLCREFLTATCEPCTEVISSGTGDSNSWESLELAELLPLPSVYRRRDQGDIKSFGEALQKKATAPEDKSLKAAYEAAVAKACKQVAQATVFPVLFGAAVCFEDGRVHSAAELKGMEYGCTVDAVTLLLPEMQRAKEDGLAKAVCIVQADQYGVAHAPFAAARALLVEHGFGDVLVSAHGDDGKWVSSMPVKDTLPHYGCGSIF